MTFELLEKEARILRREILKLAFEGHGIHISSSLSIADIITVLYFNELKVNPLKLKDPKRDKFILSKGHGVSALYAALARRKFFPKRILSSYGQEGTILGAHPETAVSGVELATGSLGHGLSVGAGLAMAAKLDGTGSRTFVLLSDGECQEGSVWETALFAGHNKLENLISIIDYNKLQALGRVKEIGNLEPFALKWKSFGWEAIEIDGHNIKKLSETFNKTPLSKNKPTAIIAHTVAGRGVSFLEDNLAWHYSNLSKELYLKAIKELEKL